jgi:hypothetical protein
MLFVPSSRLFLFFSLWLLTTYSTAQAPVGELYASDATGKGSVVLAGSGTPVMSGSSVTAGETTALVRLERGGELKICRGTAITVTSSTTGTEIMVGLSRGTIQTHYTLAATTDTIMTPDFQISLLGPGTFHLAVSADQRGNTCIQALPENTGLVKLSELMGDSTYTMKTNQQAFFHAGRASNPGVVIGNCGCPKPLDLLRAAKPQILPPSLTQPAQAAPVVVAPAPAASATAVAVTLPPPADRPGDILVQVEAPFVFRATEAAPPAPPYNTASLRLAAFPAFADLLPEPPQSANAQVVARQEPKKKKKRGFWGFLASIFGGG